MRNNYDGSVTIENSTTRLDMSLSHTSAVSSRSANVKDTHSYVGFANFPNQVFRRAVKNGFEFTLMVVGQSGLGKSTFINSLFSAEINDPTPRAERSFSPTTQIEEKTVRLIENGVILNLTLVDCPGFGDAIDNNKCWEPIVEYVERKYLDYFSEETKIERAATIPDRRVHLCLYFIAPTGHGLKQLDVEFMKRLHERVNVIPVIAKADTMTAEELTRFKTQVTKELEENNIKLYKFPEVEDEDEKKQFDPLRERVPFAVVGSNQVKEVNNRRVRYREYPWGVVEVENLKHNDFIALRDLIIRTYLIDMIAVTRSVHYENFRFRQMSKGPKNSVDRDPFTQLEHERQMKENELEAKKAEMEKIFNEKVDEREKKLAARQAEIDDLEAKNRRVLQDRRNALDQLMAEVVELRRSGAISRQESRSSGTRVGENSPPDRVKPKKGLGIFKSS
uniref:Septin n=1 Tax=Parascaris univalens TaxID=6257 RepID=A0A915CAJ2_PARUN